MQGGRAENVGAGDPGDLLGVGDYAQPFDPGVPGGTGPEPGRLGPLAGYPEPNRARQLVEGLQQHLQTFAGLVAPEEHDGRLGGGNSGGLAVSAQLDAVEGQGVVAPEGVAGHVAGRGRDRDPIVEPAGQEPGGRGQPVVGQGAAGGVEGADERGGLGQQGGHGGAGGQRLVQVDHVEVLVPQGPDQPELAGRVRGDRGDGAIGYGGDAGPQRGDARIGRGPVARPQHPGVITLAA